MRVALYFHDKLPVKGYGGTQRVVVWLARGLAELGHQVTLIAGPGSRVPEAILVPVDLKLAHKPGFDLSPFIPPNTDIVHSFVPLATRPKSALECIAAALTSVVRPGCGEARVKRLFSSGAYGE